MIYYSLFSWTYYIAQITQADITFKCVISNKFKIAKKWVPVNENYFNNFIFAKFTKHMKTKNSYIEEWQWDWEHNLTPDLWVMAQWDFQWLSPGYETERVEEDTSCCWFLIGCLWRRPGSDWFAVSGPWRLETWTRGAGFLCRPCPGLRQFYC